MQWRGKCVFHKWSKWYPIGIFYPDRALYGHERQCRVCQQQQQKFNNKGAGQ